jgi:opacity protein-like surface antigen
LFYINCLTFIQAGGSVKKCLGLVLFAMLLGLVQAQTTPQNPPAEPEIPEAPSAPEPQAVPRLDFFAGYSYVSADPFSTNVRTGLNGWEATLSLNAGRWLAFVADFGGAYGTVQIPVLVPTPFPPCPPLCPASTTSFPVNAHVFTYLFGLKVPYPRWGGVTPFAQGLFGRAHVSGTALGTSETDTKFSMALGLGADYTISSRLAWRVQADYWQTRLFSHFEDNYRLSTGIVLRRTHKKRRRTLTTP